MKKQITLTVFLVFFSFVSFGSFPVKEKSLNVNNQTEQITMSDDLLQSPVFFLIYIGEGLYLGFF
mgnify:FL=1